MRPQTFIVNQTLIILHEHYALFMWNHQRWIIGRTHRKRERDIARWGEGEREKVEGEGMALVFIEDSYFGFDHRPKSTRGILRYRYWSYLHKVISRRLQILKSLVRRYFYFPTVFLVLMTSARITQMFSTQGTNTLAYLYRASVTKKKSCMKASLTLAKFAAKMHYW